MGDVWDVCIIGAGLAGLSCARLLQASGLQVAVLEASDGIGGRARTDRVQGFLLDRGFQVLQTDYPEAKRQLDYHSLDLHLFSPGALVRTEKRFHRLVDPFRSPKQVFQAALSGVGSMRDKMHMLSLRRKVNQGSLADVFKRPEKPMLEALHREGFSDQIIERFFRPFFTGVFFDPELKTSSRMFEFVYRTLANGSGALPGRGIEAIPGQLARSLPPEMVHLHSPVQSLESGRIRLASGREMRAKAVVVACDGIESARLLGRTPEPEYLGVRCVYFQAPEPPVQEPLIVLNAEGQGPITNLCVPSQVAPGYAPENRELISVTVVGWDTVPEAELVSEVLTQAGRWFGDQVQGWELIQSSFIPRALPRQSPPTFDPSRRQVKVGSGLYLCGDLGSVSSFQWALHSGRKAAEAIQEDFGLPPQGANISQGVFDPERTPSL